MKRFLGLVLLAVSIFFLLVWSGCDKDDDNTPPPPTLFYGDVRIWSEEDSLVFLTGDTASTLVRIVVLDRNGLVLPMIKVNVSLADPTVGRLVFSDSMMQDTSNSLGRVDLIYFAWANAHISGGGEAPKQSVGETDNTPGPNVIRASVLNVIDSVLISSWEDRSQVPHLMVSADPSLVSISANDSARIIAWLNYPDGNPFAGQTVLLSVSGGTFTPLPLTDIHGETRTFWHSNSTGQFIIRANYGYAADSTVITVLP